MTNRTAGDGSPAFAWSDASARPAPAASPAAGLLAVAAGLALALPPEVHPETGPLVALLLAGAALACRARLALVPLAAAVLFLAFNLGITSAPARTVGVAADLALAGVALYVARHLAAADRRLVATALLAIGAGLGAFAILQRFVLLPREAALARAQHMPELFVQRLELGRAFGTHALPAALGGALVLALAAAGLLAAAPQRASARLLVLGGAALAVLGLVVTGSVGAAAGAFAGALVVVLPRVRGWGKGRVAALVAGAALLVAALAAMRAGGDLGLTRADNPLRLRAGNWRGAALLFAERPVTGWGLGAFGAAYPHVRRAGDVETIYAHDSWLQLAAEGGLPALAVLGAAAFGLLRLARRGPEDEAARWALAGAVAFVAHNLFDFTFYLPGVAVPAAALAGFARASGVEQARPLRDEEGADEPPPWRAARHLARVGVVLLCLAAAVPLLTQAVARRALAQAEARPAAEALEDARQAVAWSRWDPVAALRAGRVLLGAEGPPANPHPVARALAQTLVVRDAESPASWHFAMEVALAEARASDALRFGLAALRRHPADAALQRDVAAVEDALRKAGFLERPLAYGGERPHVVDLDWEQWDLLILLLEIVLAVLVVRRWIVPGPAPAAALALAFVLLAAPWGEGGALPGARLGRAVLVLVAALALLWPRRDDDVHGRDVARAPLVALLPAFVWAALAAGFAPDAAAARDGYASLLAAGVLLLASWHLARINDSWPVVVMWVFAAAAALSGVLWAIQKAGALAGFDIANASVPLRADPWRPAGDFLHPGHLGTYLVAAGLAVAAHALAAAPPRRLPLAFFAGALIVAGLAGGARASLLALFAGGLVVVLSARDRRLARYAAMLVGLALAAGGGAVVWRFAAGDQFAYSRLSIWRAALAATAERPWFGAGPGAFSVLAPRWTFPDPVGIARYGKSFEGPHSDLLALFVNLGVPGAAFVLAALAWTLVQAYRGARAAPEEDRSAAAGLLAASVALLAHGLVDDFLADRPAAAVALVVLLGALAGRAAPDSPGLALGRAARAIATAGCVTLFLAAEVQPWAADVAYRAGAASLATRLDPQRAGYWLADARRAAGPPVPCMDEALDRTGRALLAAPASVPAREERARVMDALCHGPLGDPATCDGARAAWGAAIESAPHEALLRHARARLAATVGDFAAARADLEDALGLEPDYVAARIDLARVLAARGDTDGARRELSGVRERLARFAAAPPPTPRERLLAAVPRDELRDLLRRLGMDGGNSR